MWAFPLTFRPGEGRTVRILRVSGDVTARWTTRGGGRAEPGPGLYTGFLAAVATAYPSMGSTRADFAADDTLAYVQGDIGADGVARAAFAEELRGVENAVLGEDDVLWFVAAKYLDETPGLATHLEVTFSQVRYRFEPVEGCEAMDDEDGQVGGE